MSKSIARKGFQLRLVFSGGVDEVTGSRHLIETEKFRLLLDCGLFQGHRHQAIERNKSFTFNVSDLDAVVLSHAHIDHSGGLPILVKAGYNKTIHCTKVTAELLKIMLMDSAYLQEEDAKFFNKIHSENDERIEPLYTQEDVIKTMGLVVSHPYDEPFPLDEEIQIRFLNAGHVLGSAMVQVEVRTVKELHRVLFTGDLGRRKSLLMTPPAIPKNIDTLLLETTYGGRSHEPISEIETIFEKLVHRAVEEKGKVLIPSFALERTQEVVYLLEKLRRENRIPPIHLYVDSPMATDITEVFNRNLDSYTLSPEFRAYIEKKGDPFGLGTVRYVRSVEESKRLNDLPGPRIILAGSGMCEGGRILHHLRNGIEQENTIVILVGYQVEGTLGRRLAEGAKKVKIFGLQHNVHATIFSLNHFSSHADQDDLTWEEKWFREKIVA